MGEPQTPYGKGGQHNRRLLPNAIYTKRLGETEQIGGLRGCRGNGANHKRTQGTFGGWKVLKLDCGNGYTLRNS